MISSTSRTSALVCKMRDTTCGRTVSHCEAANVSKAPRGSKGEVARTNEIRRDRLRVRSVLDVAIRASEKSGQLVRFSVVRAAGGKVLVSILGSGDAISTASVLGWFGFDAFEDARALAKLEPDREGTRQGLEDEFGPAIESSQVQLDGLHAERRHFAVDDEAVS